MGKNSSSGTAAPTATQSWQLPNTMQQQPQLGQQQPQLGSQNYAQLWHPQGQQIHPMTQADMPMILRTMFMRKAGNPAAEMQPTQTNPYTLPNGGQ